MVIETIPVKSIWSWVCKVFPWIVRWRYSREKLAKLVYVDIRPRYESVAVDLGQVASFRMYLQLINLTPFHIELDRGSFKFHCAGVNINTSILKKQKIAPGEVVTLYLNDPIPDGHADQIARYAGQSDTSLEGNIEFNCKVHSFAKTIEPLSGIKPRYLNISFRKVA
ncbi:hypothetical protein J3L11_12895 [Shewanella sp. 4t3-1-2LB]|uniref:hypothetical protein n=1 Tax=Shewanella sp. 4t3-1-2LB TaxID=2817682 RepID=UPI001A988860|nr:hypothetical protein [Shewanella sp. 4t3-1-2LB]MBO1272542.1 hypothetical protein [Shewanella sp. 4t3-1-2LB]